VGSYFTGEMLWLTLINDHDVSSPTGESRFSNVRVYEAGEENGAGVLTYLHTDHLGAVVKATDGAGSVVWDGDRKPFGERVVTTGAVEMVLGFPGQYYDQETGNYYNYFRDYDPATGRYLQSDPIGLKGGVGTYLYALSNPIMRIDPRGLYPCPPNISDCLDTCFKAFNKCMENATWFGNHCVKNGVERCSQLSTDKQRNACITGVRLSCRTAQNLVRLGCMELLAACTGVCVLPSGDTRCDPCEK
jgi:RHS repeat-associated protein